MTPFFHLAALQLSSNPATWLRPSANPGAYFAAPLLLLLYYLTLFLLVHRRRDPVPLIPQYAPPKNLSPAALRYIFTGDSDRKSVAAVLLQLASRGLISVKGHQNWFILNKLTDRVPPDLPREELKVFSVMFLRPEPVNTLRIPDEFLAPDLPLDAYPVMPFAGNNFNALSNHIQRALREAHESTYFTRHLAFTVPATILSIGLIIYTTFLPAAAFWISSILIGTVLLALLTPVFRDFIHNRYRDPGNWAGIAALLIVGAVAMAGLARNMKHFEYIYLSSLVATLFLNVMAPGYLRVPKLAARALAPAIEGYREFLSRVEVDPLHRLDHPQWHSGADTQHMAYAVALDLPGSWEAYVASSHPADPLPLTPSTSPTPAPAASVSAPAISSASSSPAVSKSAAALASLNNIGPGARLRAIPTSGSTWRFIPAGEKESSPSPLSKNWWRYAILFAAIAIISSPLMDSDPIAAYGTIFAIALVLAVLGFLFRPRD
jgi:hypothetical protein